MPPWIVYVLQIKSIFHFFRNVCNTPEAVLYLLSLLWKLCIVICSTCWLWVPLWGTLSRPVMCGIELMVWVGGCAGVHCVHANQQISNTKMFLFFSKAPIAVRLGKLAINKGIEVMIHFNKLLRFIFQFPQKDRKIMFPKDPQQFIRSFRSKLQKFSPLIL